MSSRPKHLEVDKQLGWYGVEGKFNWKSRVYFFKKMFVHENIGVINTKKVWKDIT